MALQEGQMQTYLLILSKNQNFQNVHAMPAMEAAIGIVLLTSNNKRSK